MESTTPKGSGPHRDGVGAVRQVIPQVDPDEVVRNSAAVGVGVEAGNERVATDSADSDDVEIHETHMAYVKEIESLIS
jgi:hypothetical protein